MNKQAFVLKNIQQTQFQDLWLLITETHVSLLTVPQTNSSFLILIVL